MPASNGERYPVPESRNVLEPGCSLRYPGLVEAREHIAWGNGSVLVVGAALERLV